MRNRNPALFREDGPIRTVSANHAGGLLLNDCERMCWIGIILIDGQITPDFDIDI